MSKKKLDRHHIAALMALQGIVNEIEKSITFSALCLKQTASGDCETCTACRTSRAATVLAVGLSKLISENHGGAS